MREGFCQSDEHWNRFEGNVGETSERPGGAHMGFSEPIDTIFNWTDQRSSECKRELGHLVFRTTRILLFANHTSWPESCYLPITPVDQNPAICQSHLSTRILLYMPITPVDQNPAICQSHQSTRILLFANPTSLPESCYLPITPVDQNPAICQSY